MDTFRLLSRFGTRLRARHGAGTKRHIKFDNYSGSLFANIKLPGEHNWTRISPEMACNNLESSVREENQIYQRRLGSKLILGPRDRPANPLGPVKPRPKPRGNGCPSSWPSREHGANGKKRDVESFLTTGQEIGQDGRKSGGKMVR